jgi:hypothetical protein
MRFGRQSKKMFRRTVLLHDLEELDNDLGGGADQDLTLASLLGVVDALKRVVQNGGSDHFGGGSKIEILGSRKRGPEVSVKKSC